MAHPVFHAESSARKHGGKPEDYLAIHNWFDESKAFICDVRHRALRHHAEGIFLCERIFGITITNSDGKKVPVRAIGEQHVFEDLGRIPSASDWLTEMPVKPWMGRGGGLKNPSRKTDGSIPVDKKAKGNPEARRRTPRVRKDCE